MNELLSIERLALLFNRVNHYEWDPLLGKEPEDRKDRLKKLSSAYEEIVSTVGPDVVELLYAVKDGGDLKSWLNKRHTTRQQRKRKCFWMEILQSAIVSIIAVLAAVFLRA